MTVGQQLWVMGGWDNNNFQDSVEIFDTQAGKWMPFKDMKMPHAYFAAAQLDGLVYAVAGMQERQVSIRCPLQADISGTVSLSQNASQP